MHIVKSHTVQKSGYYISCFFSKNCDSLLRLYYLKYKIHCFQLHQKIRYKNNVTFNIGSLLPDSLYSDFLRSWVFLNQHLDPLPSVAPNMLYPFSIQKETIAVGSSCRGKKCSYIIEVSVLGFR